jgi:hypothetical protein
VELFNVGLVFGFGANVSDTRNDNDDDDDDDSFLHSFILYFNVLTQQLKEPITESAQV